jgi:hypothetical protein
MRAQARLAARVDLVAHFARQCRRQLVDAELACFPHGHAAALPALAQDGRAAPRARAVQSDGQWALVKRSSNMGGGKSAPLRPLMPDLWHRAL